MTEQDLKISAIRKHCAQAQNWLSIAEGGEHPNPVEAITFAHEHLRAALDKLRDNGPVHELAAAPRVFFPGDTVPAGVAVMDVAGEIRTSHIDWKVLNHAGQMVQLHDRVPSEWQAIVDRARAAREGAAE
jgi:hypothetical protein